MLCETIQHQIHKIIEEFHTHSYCSARRPESNANLTYTFFKTVQDVCFYILYSVFEHYKKQGLYTRRHFDSYCIFLCKVIVLTCLIMAKILFANCAPGCNLSWWRNHVYHFKNVCIKSLYCIYIFKIIYVVYSVF